MSFYDVLHVNISATRDEIVKAFRTLALEHHPDKQLHSSLPPNAKNFQKITEAYETLSNKDKRWRYDQILCSDDEVVMKVPISGAIEHSHPARSTRIRLNHERCRLTLPDKLTANPHLPPFEHLSQRSNTPKLVLCDDVNCDVMVQFQGNTVAVTSLKLLTLYLENKLSCKKCALQWLSDHHCEDLMLIEAVQKMLIQDVDSDFNDALRQIIKCVSNSKFGDILTTLFGNETFSTMRKAAINSDCANSNQQQLESIYSSCDDSVTPSENGKLGMFYIFSTQKHLKKRLQTCNHAEDFRQLAYYTVDYANSLALASPLASFNQLLHSCLLFKEAQKRETAVAMQYADENAIVTLCTELLLTMPTHLPYDEFYFLSHIVHFLSHLHFTDARQLMLLKTATRRIMQLSTTVPLLLHSPYICSNLDLIRICCENNLFLQQFLKHTTNPLTSGDRHTLYSLNVLTNLRSRKPLNDDDDDTDQGKDVKNKEEMINICKLRYDMTKAFLDEQGFSLLHMSRNIHAEWNTVAQSKNGYWQFNTGASLPFDPRMKTYASLNGFQILPNGRVVLVLQEFNPLKHESWQKAFTDLDLQQMFAKKIQQSSFSLDPVSHEFKRLSLQQMVFKPDNLRGTEYLFAQFAADYWLKALRQGTYGQMEPPYDMKELDFAQFPSALEEIMRKYHASESKAGASRVWIEASVVPTFQESDHKFTLGDPRMTIKTHTMAWENGELKDCENEKEGWYVFILKNIDCKLEVIQTTSYEFRAIIFYKTNDMVSFFENGKQSAFGRKVELTQSLYDELISHKRGQIPLNEQTRKFLYNLVTYTCKVVGKPHYYSPDRVLVESLSDFYDEFAKIFPVWNRLKQLAKIVAMVRHVEMERVTRQNLIEMHHVNSLQTQCKDVLEHIKNVVEPANIAKHAMNFNKTRSALDLFTYTAASPKVISFCAQYGGNVNDAKILAQMNAHGKRMRESVKNSVQTEFAELRDLAGHAFFDQFVIEPFLNGDVQPLAQERAKYDTRTIVKNALCDMLPFTLDDAVLYSNDIVCISAAIERQQNAQPTMLEAKASINDLNMLFNDDDDKKHEKKVVKNCDFVPAVHSNDDYGYFVCGGVRLTPMLSCRISADYCCRQLNYPTSSSFSSEYSTRCEAQDLISKLKRSIDSIWSYNCDTSAVKSLMFDIESSLRASSYCSTKSSLFLSESPLNMWRTNNYWNEYCSSAASANSFHNFDALNQYEFSRHNVTQSQFHAKETHLAAEREQFQAEKIELKELIEILPVIPYWQSSVVEKTFPFLYRGDTGDISEIFEKGRVSHGQKWNLYQHHVGKGESGYVSTSTCAKTASHYPWESKTTNLFKISTSRQGVNMEPHVAKWHQEGKYVHLGEFEVAFKDHILPHEIQGAWRVDTDGMGLRKSTSRFIPNASFQDPAGVARVISNYNTLAAKGLMIVGVVVDANSLYHEVSISRESGDYTNTKAELARISGGWSAAIVTSSLFAEIGERAAGPNLIAKVVCGAAMGIAGGYLGYKYGSEQAQDIFYESMDGMFIWQKQDEKNDYLLWHKSNDTENIPWEMLAF